MGAAREEAGDVTFKSRARLPEREVTSCEGMATETKATSPALARVNAGVETDGKRLRKSADDVADPATAAAASAMPGAVFPSPAASPKARSSGSGSGAEAEPPPASPSPMADAAVARGAGEAHTHACSE